MHKTKLVTVSVAVLLAVVLSTSAACYRHTVNIGDGAPTGELLYDHWEHFWIVGLIGDKVLDVEQICPSGNATIESRQTFLNGLVSALTSGIYSPRTLRLRCEDGNAVSIPLESDEVQRIVSDEWFADWVAVAAPELLSAVVKSGGSESSASMSTGATRHRGEAIAAN